MENRGGYGYGIWLLLTPQCYIPFEMKHKFHITLISNIYCKRTASKIFQKVQKENFNFPSKINTKELQTMKFSGKPYSSIGWKANIEEWAVIIKKVRDIYKYGEIPEVPHISLSYFWNDEFEEKDYYFKDITFKVDLVIVDMNDSNPENWKVGLN